jgi:hypothetical protein
MAKMIKEKKTGEMYSSKAAMEMHEKKEGMGEMMMEYGKKAAVKKKASKSKSKMPMKAMKKK